jgi:manganese/iron transport system permease protein
MAGVVWFSLLGFDPGLGAVSGSVAAALGFSAIRPERIGLDRNVNLAAVFSLMMGLTFLGLGLNSGSRTELLSMLWGSILFASERTVYVMAASTAVLFIFVFLFNSDLKAMLFSRSIACSTGTHSSFVYLVFMIITAVILAVDIQTVGGLMIFALLINPAAAAYQLFRSYRVILAGSSIIGALSSIGGFLISYYFNLPTGACIVILSTLILFGSAAVRPLFRHD